MIGWTVGGRVHWKSSAKNVTHPSNIPALGSLPSEFPCDFGYSLEFMPPFTCVKQTHLITFKYLTMLMSPSKPPDSYQTYSNESQTQPHPPSSPLFSQKRPPPTGRSTTCPTAMFCKPSLGLCIILQLLSRAKHLSFTSTYVCCHLCVSLRGQRKKLTILCVWWLQLVLKKAGADNVETTFLFSDTQLKKEKFLEDINNILNTGEVRKICKCVLDCK